MTALARNVLTVVSALYFVAVGYLIGRVPLTTLNVLLLSTVAPGVWLIWAFCRWSAYQHSRRWAKDIEKVHGPSVVARREVVRR